MANINYGDVTFLPDGSIQTPGDICVTSITDCAGSLGTANQFLTSTGSALLWQTNGAIQCSLLTAKGDIIVAGASALPVAFPVGANGQILTACSTCGVGVTWATPVPAIPCACVTGKGAIITGTAASAPTALVVGTDGQVLTACSLCSTGLTWATVSGGATNATPTSPGIVYGCSTPLSQNAFLGFSAGGGVSGAGNVAIGYQAMPSLTSGGNGNVAIGRLAMGWTTTSSNNVAIGTEAMRAASGNSDATAVGVAALCNANGTCGNVAIGSSSLLFVNSGCLNTAIGLCAGRDITSGSCNLIFGACRVSVGPTAVYNVVTENNRIVMGHTSVTNAYIQVAWTIVSDARDKIVHGPVAHGLNFVEQLNPVAFTFRKARGSDEPNGVKRYGFLAQDILALEGGDPVIIDNEDDDKLRYNGEALVPVLVNAIKELSQKNKDLEARVQKLEGNG